MPADRAFNSLGDDPARHPVLITVPHAGRLYPAAMARDCRLPLANLRVLEDRHADALPQAAFEQGFSGLVANVARGWIDLNRDVREFDPGLVEAPAGMTPQVTRKVQGGLGVIPRRIGNGGEIWRRRISADDFAARIEGVHRPYHGEIEARLARLATRFGCAILIDLHSMPSLDRGRGEPTPDIVIGDAFGKAAAPWVSALVADIARRSGLRPALNAPYAGGFSITRHGRPARDVHAIQIEIDRSLYLDRERIETGPGLARVQAFVSALAQGLSAEALSLPLAAE